MDVNPGDRASKCGGLMEPVEIGQKNGSYVILHRCQRCGFVKWNKKASEDDMAEIIKISGRVL